PLAPRSPLFPYTTLFRSRQVFFEDNSIVHVSEYEGDAARRPLTFDEVQALFDAADGLAARIRSRRRKGAVQAVRDAALLKCVYRSEEHTSELQSRENLVC